MHKSHKFYNVTYFQLKKNITVEQNLNQDLIELYSRVIA